MHREGCIALVLVAAVGATIYHVPLDSQSSFSWTLDYPQSKVQVEVHVPILRDEWFAIGFSDYGDLSGADLCVMWQDWRGKFHFQVIYSCYTRI